MRGLLIALVALATLLLATACGPSTSTPTPLAPTATAATVATTTPTIAPLAIATTTATATTEAEASATPSDSGEPGEPGVDTSVSTSNIFEVILGPAEAPPSWSVRPCEGNGPLLCVFDGREQVGTIEFFASHIETLPEFGGMLSAEGLVIGSIDYRDPNQAALIRKAFDPFIENNHKTFEEDRKIGYGDKATYNRLPVEDIRIGDVPGVRYGFTMTDENGKVLEQWPSYAAFDGRILYILVPHYDPDSFFSFTSLEVLEEFEPFVPALFEGLKVPLPVEQTAVKSVTTLARIPLEVTGRAPGEGPWRITCPGNDPDECWVSDNPQLTQPEIP
jgi:hypothetical protein